MKYVMVTQSNAVKSSCTEGKYFVRKMLMKYGRYGDNSILLSLKLLKQMAQEFSDYIDKTKIKGLAEGSLQIHFRVFFEEILYNIPRKNTGFSDAWNDDKYDYDNPMKIVNAFWKELKRVAL